MKKQIIRYLLFFIPALVWPAVFMANTTPDEKLPSPAATALCEAPAPQWIITTNITTTSVSLLWQASQVNMYYKVDVTDLTNNTAFGTFYTVPNYITVNNLAYGHTYQFDVSASYCPYGPYGPRKYIVVPPIIIEFIVQLQDPCRPGEGVTTGSNTSYEFCVQQSGNQNSPYTNGFVGSLQYNGSTLNMGIAVVGTSVHMGKIDNYNSPFSFSTIGDSDVKCKYVNPDNSTVDLFTISDLHLSNNYSSVSLSITFDRDCGTFNYCGTSCPFAKPAGGDSGELAEKVALRSSEDEIPPQISPNPFGQTATFRYELAETGPVEINLFDATGRLVRAVENATAQGPGAYEATIDGSDLPEGVYFLQTWINQKREAFALVKRE